MSWEGYFQCICANGHYFTVDGYEQSDGKCQSCGAGCVWSNTVDLTNGSFDLDSSGNLDSLQRIDGYVELVVKEEATYETCNLGHQHQTKTATYHIPEGVGHKGPFSNQGY